MSTGQSAVKIDLTARHVMITGGTRGIGQAMVLEFLKTGATVSMTGTSAESEVDLTWLPEDKPVQYFQVNFSEREQTEEFAHQLADSKIDILINNAGINKIGPFAELDMEDVDRIFEVNLRTPFLLCKSVLPYMKEKGWGRIINISSIFGVLSKEFRAPYSASKFGLDGMTAALAAEVAEFGILANCIAPGFTRTDLTREVLGEDGMAQLAKQVPARRLADPVEVARLAVWLASAENSYTSGQVHIIDGGFTRV